MPHPISATGKDSHSEISTPKSASAPKLTSSTNPTASSQGPLIINFSSLAESVVLASSVNVKLDNIKDSAVQSESEHRRNQKYNAAYHSLVDRSGLRHETSQKAKIRLSNQFESLTKNQRDIASRLDNPETQAPAPITSNTDTKESIQNIIEEIAKVRKEVQAFQIALDDQKREWLSKSDFDRYSSKAVNHNDLAQLVNRKDFLTVEERLTTRGSDITNLEGKLSDLAVVTQDRHREGQGTQQQNMTRFEGHGTSISNAQKQQSQLKTTLDAQKADFDVHTADLQKLQESLSSLKQVVHGDPDNNELGLILSSENNTNKLAQSIVSADDLAVRIQKLEEAIHEKDRQQSSIPPAVQPGFLGEIAALRQDFDRLGEEQKGEYTIIAEAIDKLETGLKESQEHIARLEETAAKQNTQLLAPSENSTDPPQADSPAITNNLDHVKLEQLETDIKALNTHLVVQKKQFDNLTTEHLAKSIINQMKQLYKEHPGHVQDKLRTIEGRQGGIEAYLTQNLEPRLATMQAHLNGRATNDEVQTLSRRNQILEENINQTYEHAAKSGKDLSDKIDVVKDEVARHEKGLDDIRQSAILKSETTTQRLDGLQGDVEILNQEAYLGTATDSTKQDLLRRSLKYQNRICLPENAVETRHPKSLESNEASISGGQAGSMSSSRDNSVMSRLSGAASRSADDSSGPSINNKRKRQSYKSVLDSESDNEHSTAPKVSRRTETT